VALPDVAEEQRTGAIACPGAGRGYRMQTTDHRGTTRKTMIPAFARTALARKLLVALWQLVTTAEVPEGVVLRPAV